MQDLKFLKVPQRWFLHFYAIGLVATCGCFILVSQTYVCGKVRSLLLCLLLERELSLWFHKQLNSYDD